MNIGDVIIQVNQIIAKSPYTKKQVLEIMQVEPSLTLDEIFALGVAMEYLRERGKKSVKVEMEYIKRRDKLSNFYKDI